MKIKSKPDEFVVEEVIKRDLVPSGDYAVYLVEKRGVNTWDVIRDIAKRLRISPYKIGYCGLKDRYSVSRQYISIPAKSSLKDTIEARNYRAVVKGFVDFPLSRSDLVENAFHIVVRDVGTADEIIEEHIASVLKYGFVNYYDDQRFGSFRHKRGFAALKIIKGEFKEALRMILTYYSRWDSSEQKSFKRFVDKNWRNWDRCLEYNYDGWERKVLEFLSKREFSKSTAKKALSVLDRFQKEMLMVSFQSYIWNETVYRIITDLFPRENLIFIKYIAGVFAFYKRSIPDHLKYILDAQVPTPSPKLKLDGFWAKYLLDTLKSCGVEDIARFRTTIKDMIFRSHRRNIVAFPRNLSYEKQWDEMYPAKRKWILKFSLEPGSYATVLIKRLFYKEVH